MLTHNDQQDLFRIVSNTIKMNVTCYAFGGTAMMFYGFKDETKDVDLLCETKEERDELIRVLKLNSFTESSPFKIYIDEKLRDPHRPLMLKRYEYSFDIFVTKIFQTLLSPRMKEDVFAVHEYKGTHTLTVHVFRTEHIVLLKAVTERKNDFEDIRTLVTRDTHFDWQYLIDEVVWQYKHGDGWVLVDMIKTIKELKKYVFIEEKYLKQLTAVLS